ncbi:hypothetical protein GN244_ATG03391 [Phytophthora infestans]|uniref:Uncharacterized protein n=1 Tax=Phytophthora infestans TaxID=4787 RepID=A0A833WKZ9_PHYIN|nr:hypothetical protein GN244_ATG03391 [Phytophthora infestans]
MCAPTKPSKSKSTFSPIPHHGTKISSQRETSADSTTRLLLRADNKASLLDIIDHVRELGDNGEEAGDRSKASQRNGPSPLERDRFRSWAADVEKILLDFEPSDAYDNDPLVRLVERLQYLQDGHVCLAEVAMDARAILMRWDRAGVFDEESSSEDDEDDTDEGSIHFRSPDPVKENLRRLEQSYAYQSVQQRAAAGIIKRNVLIWVRSKASFCDRVAEIEIFGRTTEALLKELRVTTPLSGVKLSANTDLFAPATGRGGLKPRYNASMAFKDLLQFSKHMALYPVDQALRTVEDVTRRRYLFDSRCALKIQAVWRRIGETVRARRLRRAVEELRLKREKEAQAKREAAKEAKKKASDAGKRKVTKVLKRSSTKRSSLISSAVSKLTSAATVGDENTNEPPKETIPARQESTADTTEKQKTFSPPVPPVDTANRRISTRGKTIEDKHTSPASTPRRRQRASQLTGASHHDSDDDTSDVEAAWKSFMDTVAVVLPEEVPDEREETSLPEEEPPQDSIPTPPLENTWEGWSDDEIEEGNNGHDNDGSRPPTSSTPPTPDTPQIKIMVSINKNVVTDTTTRPQPRKGYKTSRRTQTQSHTKPSTPAIRAPSSLPFDATLQNHTGPYTGAGQLSLMAPFIDADRSKTSQSSVVLERKHLYELDFKTERMDVSFLHAIQALGMFHEPEEGNEAKTPDKVVAVGGEAPRAITSRRTTVERLRSITEDEEQNARVRSLLDSKNRELTQSNHQQPSSDLAPRGGMKIQREVVLRKGSRAYSPLTTPPAEDTEDSVDPASMESKAWHRSTIAVIPEAVGAPNPPVARFRSRYKRRINVQQRTTEASVEIQVSPKKPPKRTEKGKELPLLLRRSRAAARRREIGDHLPEDKEDQLEIPAPDVNKQMWKRGGELPELALAQIRDRVGYQPRSAHPKRMSIIAGRAPPMLSVQSDDTITMKTVSGALDEQPETIFPVDEEDDQYQDSDTSDADDGGEYTSNELNNDEQSDERSQNTIDELQVADCIQHTNSDELSEELRLLHLASQERKRSRHRSLLAHLQNGEDDGEEDARRQSNDLSPQYQHERRWPRHRNKRRSVKLEGEGSDIATSDDVEVAVRHFKSSDEEMDPRTRRRLRVKTRDAKSDPCDKLSEDDDDEHCGNQDVDVSIKLGMTQKERDEAFQKLLTQYLGLLQCAPAEVARRLQVS